MMAGGMEAEHDLAAWGFFQPQALGANRHSAIGSDLNEGAHAPDIIPPRATWHWSHDRTVFFPGLVPSPLGRLPQFAMDFVRVVVCAQVLDVLVGDGHLGDFFAGKVG